MPKEGAESEAEAAAPAKGPNPWMPVIMLLILMPAISFGLTQYVLIPRLKASVAPEQVKGTAAGEHASAAKKGEAKDVKPAFSYEFSSIVVNLAGAMGTRYLKASFTLFSSNPDLQKIVTESKPQLLDVALNVLSSKTLSDLETAGSKNLVRADLIASFNQALKGDLVEQIYFSEFVVQ